jgi:class 3 adenylate cyclase
VFGDAINLSARLMVKSKKGAAEILCDEPTYSHAKYKASYKALEPMVLKVSFESQTFECCYYWLA